MTPNFSNPIESISRKEWMKNFNSIHTFNQEELEIYRQAKVILSDPRYFGLWDDAVNQAIDFFFNDINNDSDAMRVNK